MSIAAEIVQQHWGGSGRPLAATSGTIHTGTGHEDAVVADPVIA